MQLSMLLSVLFLFTFTSANPVQEVGAVARSPNLARELIVDLTGRDDASVITYSRMKARDPETSNFNGMAKRALLGLRQTCIALYCPNTGLCCNSPEATDCCGLRCTLPGQVCCPNGAICGVDQQCCGNYCAPQGNQCCGDGSTNCNPGLLCVLVEGIQKCCENVDCSAGGAIATSIATITTDVPGISVTSASASVTATPTTAKPSSVTQIPASSSTTVAPPIVTPVHVTKHSDAAAIGAGVGVPVTLILFAAIGFFMYRRGKKSAQTQHPQFEAQATMIPPVKPEKPQEPPSPMSPMSPMSPAPPQYTQATEAAYFEQGKPPAVPSPQLQPQQFHNYNQHVEIGPGSPPQFHNQHAEIGPSSSQQFYNERSELGPSSSLPSQQGRAELSSPTSNYPSSQEPSSPSIKRKALQSTHSELQ